MSRMRSMVRDCCGALARWRRERTVQMTLRRVMSFWGQSLKTLMDCSGRMLRAVSAALRTCFDTLCRPESLKWALIIAASFLGSLIITSDFFPDASLSVGQVAEKTMVSPITFEIMDHAATQRSRHEALKSVKPIYDFDDEMIHDTLARISTAFSFMREYLNAEAAYRSRKSQEAHETVLKRTQGLLARGSFHAMDDDILRARFQSFLGARVTPSGFALLKSRGFSASIETDLRSLIVPVLLRGVVERREPIMNDGKQGILLRSKSKAAFELIKDVSAITDVKHAISFINSWKNDPLRDTALSKTIRLLAMDLVAVNVTHSTQKSLQSRQSAVESVKPVYFQVARGAPIIKAGEPVNEGHARMLAGLERALPAHGRYMIQMGLTLMLAFWMGVCVRFSGDRVGGKRSGAWEAVFICVLFVATVAVVRVIASLALMLPTESASVWRMPVLFATPVAAGAMLATLKTHGRTGLVIAALLSTTATLAVNDATHLFLFYFVSGVVGLICMSRITDRRSFFWAAAAVGMANVATAVIIKLMSGSLPWISDLREFGFAFSGGLLSVSMVYGIASFFGLLGHPTSVSLVKMADLNHPLLKEMALDAPGTHQHSIRVANLAETAAKQIRADPLLARVAGLWHDVGKTGSNANPSSYVENRDAGWNPGAKSDRNDKVAALVSHVAYGVEKAKEFGLPQPIIDVIQQHHGTDKVRLPRKRPGQQTERTECRHYEGPLPTTREAAIVMLANVVEPICRELPSLSPGSIRKHVKTVALELFKNGQFDESRLTLKDLDAVTGSFTRTLLEIRAPRSVGFGRAQRNADSFEPSKTGTREIEPCMAGELARF